MVNALAQVPPEFLHALGTLRKAQCRSELHLAEIPAPARLAPFAVALGAEVVAAGPGGVQTPVHGPAAMALAAAAGTEDTEDTELATGRFILLHDPDGSAVWDGEFRIVTYIRAQLEPEMGNDEMLGTVAWTWLVEALENHKAPYRAAGGTATRVLSESFGTLSGRPGSIDIELRASWTPASSDVTAHLEAWSDMVCTFAGLPPLPDGVTALPNRRRN
ncbi:MAG: enoyl-CoA hydratase [Pseudarthrobacter sp.]|nr:enoyl-CoA hydratase [Pseudarthrobacter sp.]